MRKLQLLGASALGLLLPAVAFAQTATNSYTELATGFEGEVEAFQGDFMIPVLLAVMALTLVSAGAIWAMNKFFGSSSK
jgi:hypothetical protein